MEWASALSADGYCTNTILSDIDFHTYIHFGQILVFYAKADIDIHLVAFQMRELAL